jgi:hypothetical protein
MLNGQITTKKKPETCDGDSRQKRLARVETARKEESTYNIPDRLPVNSVHWMAPNEKRTPHQVNISAYSVGGKEYDRKNRHGDLMEPQEGCVEAFESKWGAPVIGIQWHPEGYNPGEVNSHYHGNILKFMARAGEAYAAKRKMLLELQTKYPISNFSTPIHTVETSGITGIRTMPAAIEKLEYDSKKTEPQGKFQVLKSPIVYDAIPFDLTETVLEEKIEKPIVIRVLERESRINDDSNETNHTDEYKSLREFLIKSRKTQQVIAADLRVVQSTVSYFLNGKDSPKILQSFKKKYPGVSLLTLR